VIFGVPGFDQYALTPFSGTSQRLVKIDQSASPLSFNTEEDTVDKTLRHVTGRE